MKKTPQKTRKDWEIEDAVRQYSDMLFRLALSCTRDRASSEDILQDVFLHFLTDSTVFRDEEHKKAWLIRVTVNECRKFWRNPWNRRKTTLEDNYHFQTKERNEVFYLVMALPAKYRILVHLYYYERLSVKEISSLTRLKESTIQSRLHRARKKLKTEMEVTQ